MEFTAKFNFSFNKDDVAKILYEWLENGTGAIEDPKEISISNIRMVKIPAFELNVDYAANWYVEIGHLNEAEYNQAELIHSLFLMKYNSLTEEEKKKATHPPAPNKKNYLNYSKTTGIYHDKISYTLDTKFNRAKHNISEKEMSNIISICQKISNCSTPFLMAA
jgi:hypothetical protein